MEVDPPKDEVCASHVQVKFFTKQSQHAVSDSPFSVSAALETPELSNLINGLLKEKFAAEQEESAISGEDAEFRFIEFDFLLEGELLRVPLSQCFVDKNLSTETVIELEYVEKFPSPKPDDSLVHDDWVAAVVGNKGYILSGCYDNTVNVWNTDGEKLLTIPGHSGAIKSLGWINVTNDGVSSFISGAHDQTLIIWAMDFNKTSVERMHVCRGHSGSVDAVCVNSDKSRFLSGSWDKTLKIWSTSLEPEPGTGEEEEIKKKFKRSKTIDEVDAKEDKARLHTRTPLMTLTAHNEGVSGLQWMDGPKVASASWDHTIKIWDIETAKEERLIQGSKVFTDISFSPLNNLLAGSSTDRHVRIYDPRSTEGAVVKSSLTHHTGWVSSVSWSPTNEHLLLSGSYDAVAKLWDLRSVNAPLFNMSGHEDKILAVDWSIHDLMLTGGADNNLKIFRTR